MINYQNIANSVDFYTRQGFTYIEVPWLVSRKTSEITKPPHIEDYLVHYDNKEKTLVASGEQGFLYLANKGYLPRGYYQTVSPCFRRDTFDDYHQKCFMKNELIYTHLLPEDDAVILNRLIETALLNFNKLAEGDYSILQTGEQEFDITFKGVEIGSYGIRKCAFLRWAYGTGIAEPRFSRVHNYGK